MIPILSGSEEEVGEGKSQVSDLDDSNEERSKRKQGVRKGPSKRDPEIENFEFEIHWRCHFEEKDVDKNVEFKEINGTNYDVHFSFARFFEKQVDKARAHAIETFGMNAPCQVVKVEVKVKFYRATKADLASLNLDIQQLPIVWAPVGRLLKHRDRQGKKISYLLILS